MSRKIALHTVLVKEAAERFLTTEMNPGDSG
jgi:hypothetical protein